MLALHENKKTFVLFAAVLSNSGTQVYGKIDARILHDAKFRCSITMLNTYLLPACYRNVPIVEPKALPAIHLYSEVAGEKMALWYGTPEPHSFPEHRHDIYQLGKDRFAHLFKAATGRTPHVYLLAVRINHAQQLLRRDNTMTMAQVAAESGFFDQSHFGRCLRSFCKKHAKLLQEYTNYSSPVQAKGQKVSHNGDEPHSSSP